MINFLRYRGICLMASVVFLISGLAAYFIKGGFQYHIDFVGGTEINTAFEKPLDIAELRKKLSGKGWKDITIQSVGLADEAGLYKEFVVRVGETEDGLDQKFKKDVDSAIKDNNVEIRGISRVGSEVGKDIRWNSMVAITLSLLIVLLYISLRSKYRFALGAVAALAHDMLAILIIFLFFDWQISVHVLAVILTILGYSLNDTIVIFSRIRENFKKMKGVSEEEIVNTSINQTLRRTLLTSLSTLLTVLSILILGGESLRGFAWAMLIGVIFGTYSSVYIASPVMLAINPSRD